MTLFAPCRAADPPTSREAGTPDRAKTRLTVLRCLAFHGPVSAPWLERRWLTWISGSAIRGALIDLERDGLASRTNREERSPWGCWTRQWTATDEGRRIVREATR